MEILINPLYSLYWLDTIIFMNNPELKLMGEFIMEFPYKNLVFLNEASTIFKESKANFPNKYKR